MEEYEALNMLDEQRRWQDVHYDSEGNPKNDFPYPPKFVRSVAQGELSKRIKFAFAGDDWEILDSILFEPVYLTEKTVYGGYSEYTQENLTYLKVTCVGFEKEFNPSDGGYYTSLMGSLLEWLDEQDAAAGKPEETETKSGW